MNSLIQDVTERIIERSQGSRKAYLDKINRARLNGPHRGVLSCGNLAHGFAACGSEDKADLQSMTKANIAIISSYNDMFSVIPELTPSFMFRPKCYRQNDRTSREIISCCL